MFTHLKKSRITTMSHVRELNLDQKSHYPLQQGVCHPVALPYTLKSILRQKKNYGNLNISPCKIIIFKKII
jgi:hypothetical protein